MHLCQTDFKHECLICSVYFVEYQWFGDNTISTGLDSVATTIVFHCNWSCLFPCTSCCQSVFLLCPSLPVQQSGVCCAPSPWCCCSLTGSPHWVNAGYQGQHRKSWEQAAAPGLACRCCQERCEGSSAAKFKPLEKPLLQSHSAFGKTCFHTSAVGG